MSAEILDGKKVATEIYQNLKSNISKLAKKPKLVVVYIGDDEASRVYILQKEKAAKEIGVDFELIKKPVAFSQEQIEQLINQLNNDSGVTGIVVQKPLPKHFDSDRVDILIAPEKDVDGLNPVSQFVPATAKGIEELLRFYKISLKGKDVVVVGKSRLTGLPVALEFLDQNATVTICHSLTKNLADKTRGADILAIAAGKQNLIRAGMVKKGAVVIDIGINSISSGGGKLKIVGDVDFEDVSKVASYISPVPGGVGQVTVAGLMMNLVEASKSG